jgi:hypothetical protein
MVYDLPGIFFVEEFKYSINCSGLKSLLAGAIFNTFSLALKKDTHS